MTPAAPDTAVEAPNTGTGTNVSLHARPESIGFEPQASALIVVDMQNAYASRGGYLDLAGFDISGAQAVANRIKRAAEAARAASMPVFFLQNGWDYALIDNLKPQPGDIVVPKPRYSGMFHSPLDSMLRARGIRSLVFTGIATNVCVESTLRDAFHLEYFSIMLEDATYQAGPEFIQQATVYNVETFFGWVSTVDAFCSALTSQHDVLPAL